MKNFLKEGREGNSFVDWFRKRTREEVARPGYTGPRKLPERYKAQAMMSMAVPTVLGDYGKSLVNTVRNIPGLMRESEKVLSQKPSPEYSLGMTELAAMTLGGGWPGGLPARATGVGQIRGYHGSPHKFKKFSMSKVGTGQGAQSFGHGLYFSSKKEIAETYNPTKVISKVGKVDITDIIDNRAFRTETITKLYDLNKGKVSRKSTLLALEKEIDNLITNASAPAKYKEELITTWRNVQKEIAAGHNLKDITTRGELYKVILHKGKKPSEYDYLKWDEPLTEQQKNKILNRKYIEKGYTKKDGHWFSQKGEQIPDEYVKKQFEMDKETMVREGGIVYGSLRSWFGKKAASGMTIKNGTDKEVSAFLLRAGIDGIEYPSGTLSGIKGSKVKNYVVFDEKAITMEK